MAWCFVKHRDNFTFTFYNNNNNNNNNNIRVECFLESWLSRIQQTFSEPEISLPCSKEPAIGPSPQHCNCKVAVCRMLRMGCSLEKWENVFPRIRRASRISTKRIFFLEFLENFPEKRSLRGGGGEREECIDTHSAVFFWYSEPQRNDPKYKTSCTNCRTGTQ
jgi:hypothetical protein